MFLFFQDKGRQKEVGEKRRRRQTKVGEKKKMMYPKKKKEREWKREEVFLCS